MLHTFTAFQFNSIHKLYLKMVT